MKAFDFTKKKSKLVDKLVKNSDSIIKAPTRSQLVCEDPHD